MGRFFAPKFGELEITPFYSDNAIYCQEIRFSVPYDQWSEFQRSQTFRGIAEYVDGLQTQYKISAHPAPEHEQEDEQKLLRSMIPDSRESFLALIRNRFQKRK